MHNRIYKCEHLFDGKALRTYRRQLGLTQEEFSKRAGISTVSISKLENNQTPFSPTFKRQIEDFYTKVENGGTNLESAEDDMDALIFSTIGFLNKEAKKIAYKYISELMHDDAKRKKVSISVSIV